MISSEGQRPAGLTASYLHQLFPAAMATAVFAAFAHAGLVAIAARSIGLELLYIAGLSFVVALVPALAGGTILLLICGIFALRLPASLLLFFVVIQAVAIELEMLFFEGGFNDISWQYGLITAPASVVAWYRSVYYAHKNT